MFDEQYHKKSLLQERLELKMSGDMPCNLNKF